MKKFTITLFAALFILMQSVNGQGINSQKEVLDEIDEFILEQMENHHVPGLSACIVKGDSVIWNNNYGFMNLEDSIPVHDSTLFYAFSIGKSVTAATIMHLWDKQLLGLDQDINDFIPFHPDNPHVENDSISPRMLMDHTARINDGATELYVVLGDPTESLASFLENFLCPGGDYYSNNNYLTGTPGETFYYSNYGPSLNGYLVEPLTGIEFNDYVRDSIFENLNMPQSSWFLSELNMDNHAIPYQYLGGSFTPYSFYGHPAYPGITLHSSALELANFATMLLNDGVFNNEIILSTQAVDSMKTVQNPGYVFGEGCLGLFKRDDYGDRIVWGHNGGGDFGGASHLYFCPDENSAIVINTNSEQWMDQLVEYLFDYALTITDIPEKPDCRKVNMSVYPNPSSGKTNFTFDIDLETEISLSIRNLNGQEIKYIQLGTKKSGSYIINCDDFSPGIYFITLQTDSGVLTEKLIIE